MLQMSALFDKYPNKKVERVTGQGLPRSGGAQNLHNNHGITLLMVLDR